jgi:hypothetical protein
METTPIVHQDRLHRLEYVRADAPNNPKAPSFLRFVDVAAGRESGAFAQGYHFPAAFVDNGTVYVYAVPEGDGPSVHVFWSADLENWSSQEALRMPDDWGLFNTSVCRAPDGYIMAFEVGKPAEVVGERFTSFFSKSGDLRNWAFLGTNCSFAKEYYSACPTIRYVKGYFYVFYLAKGTPLTVAASSEVLPSSSVGRLWIACSITMSYEKIYRHRSRRRQNAT